MNRIYRTVFNRSPGGCQAASELTKSASKSPAARRGTRFNATKALSGLILLAPLSNAQATILGGSYAGWQFFDSLNTDVTQSSSITANDNFNVYAGTGNITLNDAANEFKGITTLNGNDVEITSASNLTLNVAANSLNVTNSFANVLIGASTITSDLTIDAQGGSIVGLGSLNVGGTTELSSWSNIALTNANNRFGGTVHFDGVNVSLYNSQALQLGNSYAATLNLTTLNSEITQTGSLQVTGIGSSTLNAGTGAITLLNNNNSFSGALNLTASSIRLYSGSNLTLGGITVPLAGALVDIQADGILTLSNQDLSAENLTLASLGGSLVTNGNLTALDTLNLTAKTGMTLRHNLTSDVLNLSTNGSTVAIGDIQATTINLKGGTLQIGNGGTSGNISGALNIAGSNTLYFYRSDTITYNGNISGNGHLYQVGPGTLILNGISTVSSTSVNAGSLIVGGIANNGAYLTSNINVDSGAQLGGHGTIKGNVTLANYATLNPGNSIGTLTVDGNVNFSPGSVFRVEANDQGQADKVVVTGQASLAGTVQVVADGAAFSPRTAYTILSANTLVGQFDAATINLNYEYLRPTLAYTNNEVSLALVRKIAPEPEPGPEPAPGPTPKPGPDPQPTLMRFHNAAVSGNQYAVADGIESLPDTHPVYRQIETLPTGRAPQALDALSGELHASTQAALLAIADTPRERLFSHLRANFRADTATDAAKPIHPLWAEVSTRQLRLGNEAHIAQARLNSTSLTVGADAALSKDWRAGAALHYDNGKLKVNDRSSQSDLESVGLTLGAGRAVPLANGQLNLMAGASYAWHRLKSRRHTGESGLDQTLKASYNGNTSQVFGELGYALPLTSDSTLEPFAGLAWTRVHTQGFTESGGSAALSGQSQSTQTTASTLGLRTQVRLPMGSGQATLQASAGWRHAFGDVQPQARLAFDGGQSFTVQGAPIARDAAVLGLGVAINLSSNAALGVNYVGQFGNDGQRDNAGELKLRWAF